MVVLLITLIDAFLHIKKSLVFAFVSANQVPTVFIKPKNLKPKKVPTELCKVPSVNKSPPTSRSVAKCSKSFLHFRCIRLHRFQKKTKLVFIYSFQPLREFPYICFIWKNSDILSYLNAKLLFLVILNY